MFLFAISVRFSRPNKKNLFGISYLESLAKIRTHENCADCVCELRIVCFFLSTIRNEIFKRTTGGA